jgi:LuxR family transcriptional regulator, maltose regulon positive regulatory protein
MGKFDEGERWLRRAWAVADPRVDPAAAMLLHAATGMLRAGRGQHRLALEAFTAAARAQSLLTGVHALKPRVTGWIAATQARLGMVDEARGTIAGFSGEVERQGPIHNARAVICIADGDPAGALDALRVARDVTPSAGPSFTLVETELLAGIAHLDVGDRDAASAAAEAALAAAERDRLMLPFAMTRAAELLNALPRHQTAHGALLADILDLLREGSAPAVPRGGAWAADELSPSELRVLRYLPTNLTRPEIASELFVSINTVNTHIRNIYLKLGARDRSSAVERARELRLLSTSLSRAGPISGRLQPQSPDSGGVGSLSPAARCERGHTAGPVHDPGKGPSRGYRSLRVSHDGV